MTQTGQYHAGQTLHRLYWRAVRTIHNQGKTKKAHATHKGRAGRRSVTKAIYRGPMRYSNTGRSSGPFLSVFLRTRYMLFTKASSFLVTSPKAGVSRSFSMSRRCNCFHKASVVSMLVKTKEASLLVHLLLSSGASRKPIRVLSAGESVHLPPATSISA